MGGIVFPLYNLLSELGNLLLNNPSYGSVNEKALVVIAAIKVPCSF